MLWAIYSIDKPDTAALRVSHVEAHKAYLDKVDAQIFFSGPQQSDDALRNIGSLWIIRAGSRAEAQAFVDAEPFFRAGLYERCTITRVRRGHFHPELVE